MPLVYFHAPTAARAASRASTSSVMQQYGRRIEEVIRETLGELGVENAAVSAVDKGALDCTVRARVSAAAFRCAQAENDHWEVNK